MRCGLVAIANIELQKWWQQPEATLKLHVFDMSDGVQPGLAPFQGSAKTADGHLWFANGSTLQMIDPGRLAYNTLAPLVHVEEVIADQKRYAAGEPVRLPAAMRNLEIDYTKGGDRNHGRRSRKCRFSTYAPLTPCRKMQVQFCG